MNIRTFYKPVISLSVIITLAVCGILLTHCKKYEVSSVIIVNTEGVSEVAYSTCRAAGTLVDIGSTGVSQHGFRWSLSSNVAQAIDGTSLGPKSERGGFNEIIQNLSPGTQYYLWAYAENEDGRIYGDAAVFTTLSGDLPTLETAGFLEVHQTSVMVESNLLSEGSAPVTEKGVCWNTESSPTLEHAHTTNGPGTGIYNSTMEDLMPGKKYYVRAYAISAVGVAYGNELTVRTLPETDDLIDARDGRVYQIVKIGEQWWMAQNLDYGEMIPLSTHPGDNATIEKYCWGDDPGNCETFGALYHWDEMMSYSFDNSQGVCPDGWHIPSDDDWRMLEMAIGLTEEESHIMGDARGGEAGGRLKALGEEFWDAPNVGATDEFGFHALGSGFMEIDFYSSLRVYAPMWTSTKIEDDAVIRGVAWDHTEIYRGPAKTIVGCAVRCVKD